MGFSIGDMYAGAKEPTQGLAFIKAGNHVLALANFQATNKANEAPKFRADFAVIESDAHKPGDIVSTIFQPYGTLFQGMGEVEAGRMMVMVKALMGNLEMSQQEAASETEKMLDLAQAARGFRVSASGYDKPPKPGAVDKDGKPKGPFCVVSFVPAAIANSAEQVQADRAKIDALPQIKARAQQSAPPAQAPQGVPPGVPATAQPETPASVPGTPPAAPGW